MKKMIKKAPDFKIEDNFANKTVAGVDEAGRGPWAGPVVSAAVILNREVKTPDINDSKKISESKRENIYNEIIMNHYFAVGIAEAHEIDRLNILQATKLSMVRALEKLYQTHEFDVIIIDGNFTVDFKKLESMSVIKGDALSLSIAAASIIAKVTRDKIMKDLSAKFSDYGFDKHKGYGTKQHIEALDRFGVTKHHRKSFSPIKKLLCLNERNG